MSHHLCLFSPSLFRLLPEHTEKYVQLSHLRFPLFLKPDQIFQYVKGEDGTKWGKTDTDGVTQGWLNLDRDTDYVNENVSADAPEATGTSGNVPVAAVTPTPEATPTPKATPTPEVTPTEKVTPTPEATPTEAGVSVSSGVGVASSVGVASGIGL